MTMYDPEERRLLSESEEREVLRSEQANCPECGRPTPPIPRYGPDSYGGIHRLRTNYPEDGVRCGRIVPTAPLGVFGVTDAASVTCPDCRRQGKA